MCLSCIWFTILQKFHLKTADGTQMTRATERNFEVVFKTRDRQLTSCNVRTRLKTGDTPFPQTALYPDSGSSFYRFNLQTVHRLSVVLHGP